MIADLHAGDNADTPRAKPIHGSSFPPRVHLYDPSLRTIPRHGAPLGIRVVVAALHQEAPELIEPLSVEDARPRLARAQSEYLRPVAADLAEDARLQVEDVVRRVTEASPRHGAFLGKATALPERLAGLAVRMEVARRTRKQQRPIARLPRQKAFCGAHLRPMGCMAHALGAMHE